MAPVQNPLESYFKKPTRYHWFFFIFIFSSKLPIFWHVLSLIFLSPPMSYTCIEQARVGMGIGDGTVTGKCPCSEVEWDRSVFTQTFQTKYDIYCGRLWLVSFSQSMVFVGSLLGAMFFGIMSDKYGRLSMFSITALVLAVSGCLVPLMPTAGSFIFIRVFEGFAVGGAIVTSYVLCIELCGVSYRELVTALFHIPLNLSHMTLPGISYLLRDSDDFQLALSIPTFLCCLMYVFTHESPKWLIDRHKFDRALAVMQKIAEFNKDSPEIMKQKMESYFASYTDEKRVTVSFWQIFKYRRVTINLMCMAFIYFTCGMGYYGVSQYIGKMSGNIHQNVAISGALLIPGTLASAVLLRVLGRKSFLMTTSFVSGILMIIVVLIPNNQPTARVSIACICNCFFFMSFIIVFLYGVELFPTAIRNSVLGFLSLMSRVGQIGAPPINSLPETMSGIVFGAMAITGGILCYPLPETKNSELPATLEDSKSIGQKK